MKQESTKQAKVGSTTHHKERHQPIAPKKPYPKTKSVKWNLVEKMSTQAGFKPVFTRYFRKSRILVVFCTKYPNLDPILLLIIRKISEIFLEIL